MSDPSLLQSYQGSIAADTVVLKYASSFKSYQGDIIFRGTLAPEGDHFFYTYEGAITLMLPKNSAFNADASNYQNQISSDFPEMQISERKLQVVVHASGSLLDIELAKDTAFNLDLTGSIESFNTNFPGI